MPVVRVWLSHDGYRDPDDNLAMLIGGAHARKTARAEADVRVAGVIFGDTKDGGQYYTLNPTGTAPAAFGDDSRYGDVRGNKWAAANHAFYREYGRDAMDDLGPGWKQFDLLAQDNGGQRPWNFAATKRGQVTAAAAAISDEIVRAIGKTGNAASPAEIVVYSAGGGANVAAEAVGLLLNQGYAKADLVRHFAVIQHGNNWVTNYEAAARELTRDFTIAISNQNYASYANGANGPGLNKAIPASAIVDGSAFGPDFAKALAVAVGQDPFEGLPGNAIFRTTRDASDAGSHAFAVDTARLLAALGDRLGSGEMRTGYDLAHLIEEAWGWRSRVIFDDFDVPAVSRLIGVAPSAAAAEDSVRISAGANDAETVDGVFDADLDLGLSGGVENRVGLRFGGLNVPSGASLEDAYFVFTASGASAAGGSLTVELQANLAARNFDAGATIDRRSYIDGVTWDDLGSWKSGETYRSPDLSGLIEEMIDDGGLLPTDVLVFRISGSGSHSAHAYDGSPGDAPRLVMDWSLDVA